MSDDGFEKREAARLVQLGEEKGQISKFAGLLVDIRPDERYPNKDRYVFVARDGKEYEVAGSVALKRRIRRSDIGCLIKLRYAGMGRTERGRFKEIEVLIQPRSKTTPDQKAMFPRWMDFEDEHGDEAIDEPPPLPGDDF